MPYGRSSLPMEGSTAASRIRDLLKARLGVAENAVPQMPDHRFSGDVGPELPGDLTPDAMSLAGTDVGDLGLHVVRSPFDARVGYQSLPKQASGRPYVRR